MALKRKRSSDSSPLSISSYARSTPDSQSPTALPNTYAHDMGMDICAPAHTPFNFSTSWPKVKSGWETADLGSRTRKRVRDNRPDERVIHETTIQKLFSAQRNHPHAEPIPSAIAPPTQTLPITIAAPPTQKSTLHSFWNISAPPVRPPIFAIQTQSPGSGRDVLDAPKCGECDAPLQMDADGMDIDINAHGGVAENPFACSDCGKSVCGTCAVVGERRHCLQCATRGVGRRREAWW